MGKRYGQRPSTLLPQKIFSSDEQALAFDLNVMLLGMATELRAQREAESKYHHGVTATRHDALALAQRARMVADAEFN